MIYTLDIIVFRCCQACVIEKYPYTNNVFLLYLMLKTQ